MNRRWMAMGVERRGDRAELVMMVIEAAKIITRNAAKIRIKRRLDTTEIRIICNLVIRDTARAVKDSGAKTFFYREAKREARRKSANRLRLQLFFYFGLCSSFSSLPLSYLSLSSISPLPRHTSCDDTSPIFFASSSKISLLCSRSPRRYDTNNPHCESLIDTRSS